METIDIENVCRLCLVEFKQVSEPLSNWIDDVLLIFGLEVCLDDGLPQQICTDCSHTLMIATKLRDTVYETDILLKNYHKTNVKAELKNDSTNYGLQLNETHSVECTYVMDESMDVKFNYPVINNAPTPMDTAFTDSLPIDEPGLRVMMEKLPDNISSPSLTYCSICLLDFTDSERFNIHLNSNIHNTNNCIYCRVKYENGEQLWKHIDSVHVNDILMRAENIRMNNRNDLQLQYRNDNTPFLNQLAFTVDKHLTYHTDMSEDWRKKTVKVKYKRHADMTEEQRNKRLECQRKRRANMTEEQKKKQSDYKRRRNAEMTEEQRKQRAEYYRKRRANMTDEQRNKIIDKYIKRKVNMTEEQRQKQKEYSRNWYINKTAQRQMKKPEHNHNWYSNFIPEQPMQKKPED